MMSLAASWAVGVSDTVRPILLIGFVVFMFAVAGLAVVLGRRQISMKQARALSDDTGVLKGATKGSDTTFDDAWLAETRAEVEGESPRQSWADAILGPGSLADDRAADGQFAPPEIRARQAHGDHPTQSAVPVEESGPVWASGTETGSDVGLAGTAHAAEVLDPASVEMATGMSPIEAPVDAPVAPEFPAYLQSELDPSPASTYGGKHAAPDAATNSPALPPFLVDNGLDHED